MASSTAVPRRRSATGPRRRVALPAVAVALPVVFQLTAGTLETPAAPTRDPTAGGGAEVLTATTMGAGYEPTFTGNGYIAVRVPPAGQGDAAGAVPIEATLAGFYARAPGHVEQRASLPMWDTLTFADGGQDFRIGTGGVAGWRQQIDLHDGVITTAARWTAPDGHVTDLRYEVLTDRARPHVAAVRLEITPRWSGTATVTDLVDGTPATLTGAVAQGWDPAHRRDWETVRTQGTGIVAGIASRVEVGSGAADVTDAAVAGGDPQTVGQRVRLGVRSGVRSSVTKYVGVASGGGATAAASAARQQSDAAAAAGFGRISAENAAAWRSLWAGRIEVLGDAALASVVDAGEFALWASVRDGVDWSVSPAGLSSDGYNGHVFWDAETWMYPALLAQHPDLALGIDTYRLERLRVAEEHARATGYQGARFPWESALDGTEQIPPPVAVNSEGLYEQHITADVALAQWQYYLATGDRSWLARSGWPVLTQAAAFWAVSVRSGPALPVTAGGRTRLVPPGGTLSLPTRRPDLRPTDDLARCQPATASSAQPGAGALAAGDGTAAR